MDKLEKIIDFVNSKLKWGYPKDVTHFYKGVFPVEWGFMPGRRFVEITNRDIRGIGEDLLKKWMKYKSEELKVDTNLEFTVHDSFMKNGFINSNSETENKHLINFFWYVVPKNYNNPSMPAFEKSIEEGKKNIDFASMFNAKRFTVHVTSPGNFLDKEEFNEYLSKIKELNNYAKSKRIMLVVETGGITKNQLEKLVAEGLHINLDTAHAYLDGLNVVELYNKFKDNIKEVHLTMTKYGKDAHEGLFYRGPGYSEKLRKANKYVIKKISGRDDVYTLLECKLDIRNIKVLYEVLS